MTINLSIPNNTEAPALKPKITVIGVGGAGGNAVNNMIASGLGGVDFVVANTDAQALAGSRTERRVQLGVNITQGLGAGSRPDVGRAAAEESLDMLLDEIQGSNMVFIAAGMGGGTGTGGAPVIAQAAREAGILTVGVVTKPFQFEGIHRMRLADSGIEELEQFVDTLIIIPNQNLFRVANEKTTFADAFAMADEVLYSGVRGVTDLMVMPGLVNLDFADIRFVMAEMGKAMMGTGEAEGERRALDAAEAAISNPLLDDTTMAGAKGVLINITGGMDMTLFEVDEAANRIRSEVDSESYIIFGSTFDESLEGKVRVSVVATGMDREAVTQPQPTLIDLTAADAVASIQAPAIEPARPEIPDAPAAKIIDNDLDIPAANTAPAYPSRVAYPVQASHGASASPSGTESATESAEEAVSPAAEIAQPATAVTTGMPGTPPPATPALGAKDAFIPPPPVRRTVVKTADQPDPFAAAAMANGPAHKAKQAKEGPARRRPTLFETVTGIGRSAKAGIARLEGSKPALVKDEPKIEPKVGPRVEPPLVSKPEPAAAEAKPEAPKPPQPGKSAALAEASAKATPQSEPEPEPEAEETDQPEEDLLDIPAFLRRQAN